MNKTVIITGATSGYGLACAKKFKSDGDTVIIASRNPQKLCSTLFENNFDDSYAIDVTSYEQWVNFKNYITDKYSHIDILVNNAGGGIKIADTTEQTKETIDGAVALNLNSVIYSSKLFGDIMKKQKDGTIINISSVCARHCWPGWSVYAAAKAGVLNFTKGLYLELRPYGVRSTCIIPAAADTGFQKNAGIGKEKQSLMPSDIANAVFYAANQPKGVVIEEMTVWGTSQEVCPL